MIVFREMTEAAEAGCFPVVIPRAEGGVWFVALTPNKGALGCMYDPDPMVRVAFLAQYLVSCRARIRATRE